MPRNLRDDFRMYYSGTYVLRETAAGQKSVLYVEDVSYNNNGYTRADIVLHGYGYRMVGDRVEELGSVRWTADELVAFVPPAGYYKFGSNAPVYLEYQVANRTNRRGFEAKSIIKDGAAFRVNGSMVARMFLAPDFRGKLFYDCCLVNSRLFWRGHEVGTLHDGALQLNEGFEYLEDHLGKYVQRFLGGNNG